MSFENVKEQFPWFLDGQRKGEIKRLRATILEVCELLEIPIENGQQARLETMSLPELESLWSKLKATRRWPQEL